MSDSSLNNSKQPNNPKKEVDDSVLERLATEELLREASRGAIRAEIVGPSGWLKSTQLQANKKFLSNTIRNAMSSNNYYFKKDNDRTSKSLNRDVNDKYYSKKKESRSKPYSKK